MMCGDGEFNGRCGDVGEGVLGCIADALDVVGCTPEDG